MYEHLNRANVGLTDELSSTRELHIKDRPRLLISARFIHLVTMNFRLLLTDCEPES